MSCVFFEVRAGILNIIWTGMGFKPYSPPDFKLIKITPCCGCRRFVFKIIDKTIRNSKFRCLSEATPYHHNVFTFTLFLPEGRAGVAWEPYNKMMLFLPPRKIRCLSLHPLISSLNLLFIYPSHLSLSLSLSLRFKWLILSPEEFAT
jgi:hypothetical protein